MSLQWEEWKQQTTDYFKNLDESLLPVDPAGATSLVRNQAYVIGNSPFYQRLTEMAREKGFTVTLSFNTSYDTYLPAAAGHLILIETHGDRPIVPLNVLEKHFPKASEGLKNPGRATKVGETRIVFFDFSDESGELRISAGDSE